MEDTKVWDVTHLVKQEVAPFDDLHGLDMDAPTIIFVNKIRKIRTNVTHDKTYQDRYYRGNRQ